MLRPARPSVSDGGSQPNGPQFNLAAVHEAVEAAVGTRECIVRGARRFTYHEVGDRSRRFANHLLANGLGQVRDRASLPPLSSGQDHVALYLHNSNEYLEAMLGAFKARTVPFNVNYRYVAEELRYVLHDAAARAIVFHSRFAPVLSAVLGELPALQLLLQVPDRSGHPLLPGALWYEDALAAQPATLERDLVESWSGDDLYMLYTGGTTGMPRGVIWRQDDIFAAAMGGRRLDTNEPWASYNEIAREAVRGGSRLMPTSPLMHGAAHWLAFSAFTNGNTVVLGDEAQSFDPAVVLDTVEAEDVNMLMIVGDAFGRPLVEELERNPRFLDSLLVIVSGGAALSAGVKQRLITALPNVMVLDGLGASETGTQASQLTAPGQVATSGVFVPTAGAAVLSANRQHVLVAGDEEVGWLAQSGRVPLGYLGDPERSAERMVTIDGTRYALTGDRARSLSDGRIELKGRDSAVINTGGEKVFAEEVEAALLSHPDLRDALVTGVPSELWGEEVVAVVEVAPGRDPSDSELLAAAGRTIARFKLPKSIIRTEHVVRSPVGKPDYAWARRVAVRAAGHQVDGP